MFEVGRTYWVTLIKGGEETEMHVTVERYEHPLLKTADIEFSEDFLGNPIEESQIKISRGIIINVTSPYFVSAELDDKIEQVEPTARIRTV